MLLSIAFVDLGEGLGFGLACSSLSDGSFGVVYDPHPQLSGYLVQTLFERAREKN